MKKTPRNEESPGRDPRCDCGGWAITLSATLGSRPFMRTHGRVGPVPGGQRLIEKLQPQVRSVAMCHTSGTPGKAAGAAIVISRLITNT